jgi:hypothetical protein
MRHFCTYFDRNYLVRGLTLYRSLAAQLPDFQLWVLCFDEATHTVLSRLNLPGLFPIALVAFEEDDAPLRATKQDRSPIEYFFTCTPSLPRYIFRERPEVDFVTYLDADLYCFADPSPVFEELAEHSVLIVPHRFPEPLRDRERYGIYNVGLVSFRNDAVGRACVDWWRDRCLAWCYDRVEDGRFADQKYLDEWPMRFPRVKVLKNEAAGVAPWNVSRYDLQAQKGAITVDGQSLIFYHFHGLRRLGHWFYDPGLTDYGAPFSVGLRAVYARYVRELIATEHGLREHQVASPDELSDLRFGQSLRISPMSLARGLLSGRYGVALGRSGVGEWMIDSSVGTRFAERTKDMFERHMARSAQDRTSIGGGK